jgi:hypothetical protein
VKWSRAIDKNDRVIYVVFLAKICRKTDLRSHFFLLAKAVCGEDRLFPDRQQRTANIVYRQVESQSHQAQRDSGSDQAPAVNWSCELSMNGGASSINTRYLKKQIVFEGDNPTK